MDELVVTAEELLVFSLSRGVPLSIGVKDYLKFSDDDPSTYKNLEYATRVLVSRGVPPKPSTNGEQVSEAELLLTSLSKPELRVVISSLNSTGSSIQDIVKDGERNLIHIWDKLNNHLIKKFVDFSFFDRICFLSGQSEMTDSETDDRNSIKLTNLKNLHSLDDDNLREFIRKQNGSSEISEDNLELLVKFFKGKLPTVLVLFDKPSESAPKVFLMSWFFESKSSAWLMIPNEDNSDENFGLTFQHLSKLELGELLQNTIETFI